MEKYTKKWNSENLPENGKKIDKFSQYQDNFPAVDVEEFLRQKGYDFTVHDSRSGRWAKMKCILPGHDDSNPSFFIHLEHGGGNCYVCGSFTWNQLCETMGWDASAKDTIQVGLVPTALWKDTRKEIESLNSEVSRENFYHIPKGYKKLTPTDPYCSRHFKYMEQRKIVDLIDLFKVGCTRNDDGDMDEGRYGRYYINRIIIPVHNTIGQFIWPEGRTIQNTKFKKYYRPDGIEKTKYLFNIHRVLKKGFKWVIVVEGIIDAMMLWAWGFPAVCCFGAEVSDDQLGLLMNFDTVYICLDNDPAGIKGFLKFRDCIRGTGTDVRRIILPKNRDINKIGKVEIFRRLFDRAKPVL